MYSPTGVTIGPVGSGSGGSTVTVCTGEAWLTGSAVTSIGSSAVVCDGGSGVSSVSCS